MTSRLRHPDGTPFRDLNHNGTMEPYEDPRLPVEDRVADLPARMTLEERAGLLCHGRMLAGVHDDLLLDVVFGRSAAEGVLPFDLPSSMKEVEASFEDVPFHTPNPLFRCGHRAADHG